MDDIEKCMVNDEGYVRREELESSERDEIAESFKKQQEIITRKKNLVKMQMTQKLKEKQSGASGSTVTQLV
jgi:hypothetical protein